MRSRHTGHVGSSIRLGVGGGKGLRVYDARDWLGSASLGLVGVSKAIDLTKTT